NIPKTLTEKKETYYGEAELDELDKIVKADIENENYITYRIKKIIDKDVFREGYELQLGLILKARSYNQLPVTEFQGSTEFGMRFGNGENYSRVEEISKAIEEVANDQGVTFTNEYEEIKRQEEMWLVINVFVYGFIVMITLIGIVNVVNTISLNILLKKREFGTLGTIGMDRSQLRKMIMLEGVLHGVISSIIGGIISLGLIVVMVKIISQGFTLRSSIPLMPLTIGIIGVFIVTLLASLIPLKKLDKVSLVDTIRNIE
ncbi:MAG: ABC transporter permease, partial [Clostridium sp.]